MIEFVLTHFRWIVAGLGIAALIAAYHFVSLNNAYDRGYDRAQSDLAANALAYEKVLTGKIADIDKKRIDEKEKADAEIARLRADIADGSKRLYVKAKCPTGNQPAGSGMGNGETTAELDAATANALVGITSDGDNAIRQLSACQDIIGATHP